MMRKLTTSIALLSLAVSLSVHSANFSARNAGQGFTSITHDFTSALSNPALLTKFDADDDAYFSLNLGVMAADEHDVIDLGEGVSDKIDVLDAQIDDIANQTPGTIDAYKASLKQSVDSIVADLEAIDNKPVLIREGVELLAIIPNNYLSFGLFVNQYGRLGVTVDYDANDEQVLNDAIDNETDLDLDNLNSRGIGLGYSVAEVGMMAGYQAITSDNYDLSLGAKIKFQRLDVFFTDPSIADFDDDEFDLSDDENRVDSDAINFDLGLAVNWGETKAWHFALVVNDISEQEVTMARPDGDITFKLKMTSTAGLSYQGDWYRLSAEVDLTDRSSLFDPSSLLQLEAPKYAAIGAEVNWGEHAQFRLGARTDLNDNEADIFTVGLGISPWDVVSLDIAAFAGDNDNVGVALQLGVKI
jgi:hypothetical protein